MMKKVVFICLLSLTTCLSRPDGKQEVPATPQTAASPDNVVAPAKAATEGSIAPTVITPAATNTSASPSNSVPATNASSPATPTEKAPNTPVVVPDPSKPEHPADDNKTTNKDTPATEKKPVITPTVLPDKNATDADKNITTTVAPAHDDKKNETSTPKAEVTTKATEPAKHIDVAARGFDGPSFIGGIILTLGLLAIGFMGFKYYRSQTERNYHTL